MTATNGASGRRQNLRLVFLNVCLGLFLAALNQRAVLVSLPTLTRDFQTDLTTIQWTILAYDLTLIGLVLTMGRLGDLFGRRGMYASGYLLFVCGSTLCGLSQSPAQLIAFRILQGIGGSMIVANGRAILTVVFPAEQRGKALGFSSMAFHVGFLTGPTLGGFLIDTIGWRWNFYINIPFGLLGAYLAWKMLEEKERKKEPVKIDFLGACLLLITTTSLLYAMNQLSHLDLYDATVLIFALFSLTTLLLFVWTELQAETPILSLSLFRSRLFSAGILSFFFITAAELGIEFLLPFYLQIVMGFTPTQMGWIIIANSAVIIMVAPLAGRLSDRLGSRLLCTVGASCTLIGQFLVASLKVDSTVARIVISLALSGLGWAVFNSPNQSAILGAVPQDKVGAAAGVSATAGRIGAAMGTALAATIFSHGLAREGLTQMEIQSPQSWSTSPGIIGRTFNHTVHIINLFTLLSVFFSAVRGEKRETP